MKKITFIIVASLIAPFILAQKYIKVTINGEVIAIDSIPTISYYDDCNFSLVGDTTDKSTQWETRVSLDCNSKTSAYQIYNPLKGSSYSFCLETLDKTISLPQTKSGLSWNATTKYVNASITANTSKGWVYSIPVKLKLIPEPPVVNSFEIFDIIHAEPNDENELFGCTVKMTWDTPDFPVKPLKVTTITTNNYQKGIRNFDAPGIGEYFDEGAFDHDVIEIFTENRYGKSAIQRFEVKDFAGVENVTINSINNPKASFVNGNIIISDVENTQSYNLSLYSISGSQICSTTTDYDFNGSILWNIDFIEKGIYLLSVSTNNKSYSFKIHKND